MGNLALEIWHLGIFAMQIKTIGRSASILAGVITLMFAVTASSESAHACDPGQPCAPETNAVTDNGSSASPTAEASVGAPLALKKFTKKRRHTASRHRHSRNVAAKRSRAVPDKTVAKKSSDDAPKDTGQARNDPPSSDGVTPAVANAQAQFSSADDQNAAAAPPDQAATDILPADQLNAIDQTAAEPATVQPTLNLASVDSQPVPAAHVEASANQSTWPETSTIGKIFIAMGTLLTLASAARMFIA
jgi:hypothetical protein